MKYGTMDVYEAFEMVCDTIENDIKYCEEVNKEFNPEFLDDVLDFLQCRCDILNRVNERERWYNCFRKLEKNS